MPIIHAQFDPDTPVKLIEAIVDTFDFTLPGKGGETLGKDIAVRIAVAIQARSMRGEGPGGAVWLANEVHYAKYKEARYQEYQPGVLGGQMLSLISLLGELHVEPKQLTLTYGKGETPPKPTSRTGVPLHRHELEATDREKADWFHNGTDKQPARPFYEFDDEVAQQVIDLVREALKDYLQATGHTP